MLKRANTKRKERSDELFELVEAPVVEGRIQTGIDRLYTMVGEKAISIPVLASRLHVSKDVASGWVRVLHERGLVRVRYGVFGTLWVRKE